MLVELKFAAFNRADASQINVYLNYYWENEMTPGDNPLFGLILCDQKKTRSCAIYGLSEQLFVSKYPLNLPSEAELKAFLQQEMVACKKY